MESRRDPGLEDFQEGGACQVFLQLVPQSYGWRKERLFIGSRPVVLVTPCSNTE